MEQRDPQIRKDCLLQGFGPGFRGFQVEFFIFLHRRANYKALVSFADLLSDKSVDSGPVAFSYQEGVHRFPPRRQFVQNGHFQITVHQQRQRSGNGGCGHDQQMRVVALSGQGCPLAYAEAVLLVGDHQSQVIEHRGLGQQGMGTHRQIHLAGGNSFPDLPLLPDPHGTGQ